MLEKNSENYPDISIHASKKEATALRPSGKSYRDNFNPRLQEGGDRTFSYIKELYNNFNPRLQEGGDKGIGDKAATEIISIHASKK